MPKILRVITRLNIGGPALQVLLLSRDLRVFGYDTVLVCGHCEDEDGDMGYLVQPGDPVRWLPSMSRSVLPLRDLRSLWSLYCLIRDERPDIVHTHTAKAGAIGRAAAWLAGVPIIVHTFHGNSLEGYFSAVFNQLIRFVERSLARVTDTICVISPQQQKELIGKFCIASGSKFRLVSLGIDLAPFLSLAEPTPGHNRFTVGWLGRLVPIKGIPLLASVIEETLARNSRIRFLLAGDGPERDRIKRVACRFGPSRVHWVEWQRDVAGLLSQCDVLIQTSRNEGTPVALIQGMAAARPFVSTPVGGVVDMTSGRARLKDGAEWFDNAVLAPPDPIVFARALNNFVAQPWLIRDMGRDGRKFAASRYRKESLLSNLDCLYRDLIRKKKPEAGLSRSALFNSYQGEKL